MEGKIVHQGKTKNGEQFVIRYPQTGDARAMLAFINTISKEQTMILFQGEQLSLDFEINYVRELIERFKEKRAVHLLIVIDDKVIGGSGIEMKDRSERHKGEFGIIIAKEYRGQGLGKLLMEQVLEEAERSIPQLRKVFLSVFAINETAIAMYKQFGFIAYALLPEGLIYKDKFEDQIYLYKNVR
jgi:RimJ/RimL family protein N-acetyltransferase